MVCARRVGRTSVSKGVQCSCRLVVISVRRCGCACVDVGEWVSQVCVGHVTVGACACV